MQPLSGRFHSSVQYLLSSLAPPHVTDNGYWAFPVNHTSHAHTIEYELWLILILSLTHGIPAVVWETRSLPVGEFSSPIARLARLLSSYDFLHSLPVSILQPCSSSGIFSTARRDSVLRLLCISTDSFSLCLDSLTCRPPWNYFQLGECPLLEICGMSV